MCPASYGAPDAPAFEAAAARDASPASRPVSSARRCGLRPVFRYFDVFDRIGAFGILDGKPGLAAWRRALAARPSVTGAVSHDHSERLMRFLAARGSHISWLVAQRPQPVPA